MSRSHNIVGCEATFEPGWEARERAFSPAHGSLRTLPRQRRSWPVIAFVAGVVATLIAAALLAAR